jgi:hypothetical protein
VARITKHVGEGFSLELYFTKQTVSGGAYAVQPLDAADLVEWQAIGTGWKGSVVSVDLVSPVAGSDLPNGLVVDLVPETETDDWLPGQAQIIVKYTPISQPTIPEYSAIDIQILANSEELIAT